MKGVVSWLVMDEMNIGYEAVLNRLVRLGFGNGRECAAIMEGRWDDENLDLSLVSEIKRGANGTVEIKLIDRVGILNRLLELMGDREDGAEAFLRALGEEAGQ